MEKREYLIILYDFYSELLSDKQKEHFEDYYFNNLSLGEISENENVSRNAIHKSIKSIENKLYFYEEKLKLYQKSQELNTLLANIKDEKLKKSFVVNKTHDKAKLSKLEYEVIGYYKDKTIVKVNLITGRHHQIRVQFKNIGYPLLGDQLYGNKNKMQIKLFAYKLEFNHPTLKNKMTFKILPKWEELENETIIHRL